MIPDWRRRLYGNIISFTSQKLDRNLKIYHASSGTIYLKNENIEIRISSHLRTRKSDREHAFDILTKNRRRQYTWEEIRLQIETIVAYIKEFENN